MTTKRYILALDIGTQSSRAAVVDVQGNILHIAQIRHEVDSPHPGWAQQNPDQWWQETCQAIREALAGADVSASALAAVASCGQMHGPVGIDQDGRVTTPMVQLWCDKRCQPQCTALREGYDEAAFSQISANSVNPAWIGPKVRWYKDNVPEQYEAAMYFLTPKDFINYRLTHVAATDPSEASGGYLWDWRTDTYSPAIAEALGVSLSKFAPVHPSSSVIGAVTAEAAQLTSLRQGTPVVAGGGDFPVSMLGFGLVSEGVTADVTGTSNLLATYSAEPLIHPAIQNLRHVVDGWIPFTITDCGGLSMKWCKDLMGSAAGGEVSYEALIEMARGVPIGSDGLLFYPYMLGERRPENMSSRGAFFNLSINHHAAHFARAIMEGVAMSTWQNAERFRELGHRIDAVLCVGGGTRNALWTQMKADMLGVPLEVSREPEAGLKGAAMLGAAGVGLIDNLLEEALRRQTTDTKVAPVAAHAVPYKTVFEQFRRMYNHMLGYWQ